jgi:hypothetical protein
MGNSFFAICQGLRRPLPQKNLIGTASYTTQCLSRPVSGSGLPKTGIFHMWAGDYRRFRAKIVQFGSIETVSQFTKARNWRALVGFIEPQSSVE